MNQYASMPTTPTKVTPLRRTVLRGWFVGLVAVVLLTGHSSGQAMASPPASAAQVVTITVTPVRQVSSTVVDQVPAQSIDLGIWSLFVGKVQRGPVTRMVVDYHSDFDGDALYVSVQGADAGRPTTITVAEPNGPTGDNVGQAVSGPVVIADGGWHPIITGITGERMAAIGSTAIDIEGPAGSTDNQTPLSVIFSIGPQR